MPRPWSDRADADPLAALGLPPTADVDMIEAARRRLAKEAHPDAGGSVESMQRLNATVDRALRALTVDVVDTRRPSRPTPSWTPPPGRRTPGGSVRRDHPSFTIEALPAVAFEALLGVASSLGTVSLDDPPYLLEVTLHQPIRGWCRLELVPDAGASTVSLTTARVPGHPTPDIDEVRDIWIEALNRLDWTDLGEGPQPS